MNTKEKAEFKQLKDQVYANHRLIKALQMDNHARAIMLNRLNELFKDDGK